MKIFILENNKSSFINLTINDSYFYTKKTFHFLDKRFTNIGDTKVFSKNKFIFTKDYEIIFYLSTNSDGTEVILIDIDLFQKYFLYSELYFPEKVKFVKDLKKILKIISYKDFILSKDKINIDKIQKTLEEKLID